MLAAARALLQPARLLLRRLLDEPSQGMSPATGAPTYALLGEVAAGGRTVVVAEHALPPALRAEASVVHVLRRVAVVFSAEPGEIPEESPASARPDRRGERRG
ncbi:hypothetical protein [Streptomyces sp. NPDC048639]|uniref:hypothetical protein n=1 Tax=Streptomyces sp. NPDC048639 TaxID=3365581 RepID=UPI003711AE03